ncbi:MAG: GAF domain-containing protein [Actinobacteria bacterium]|nr:GAF domain-containing protein [Actinomycetota bacterium]
MAAVHRYDVLDTPPDGAFDRVTALAARIFEVPISTVSIVDHDRIWFKARHGLDAPEIGRDPGLCASAICQYEPWVVTDAEVDPRTLDNPLVAGELGLRFYLGVPLTTADGHNLGVLNVIDVEPREVTEDEVEMLESLAAIVVDELELRLATRSTHELRRQHALVVNDEMVQGLTAAQLALELGNEELARDSVAKTLAAARAIVAELLEESGGAGTLEPGDLIRPAST